MVTRPRNFPLKNCLSQQKHTRKNIRTEKNIYTQKICVHTKKYTCTQKKIHAHKKIWMHAKKHACTQKNMYTQK